MKAVFIALFAGMVGCASVQPVSAADAVKFREKVLYSFCSQTNCTDGAHPTASLIDVNGMLYGTTQGAGGIRVVTAGCCGTVFSLDAITGAEKVLYAFCHDPKCSDGAYPEASLIAANGVLYGTTSAGGTYSNAICSDGCGTVFSLDPSTGAEKVLYSFCRQDNCADGAGPNGLIAVNELLYGTTGSGGLTGCFDGYGCGTVFSLDPKTRAQKVLYSFCSQLNCTDGYWPNANLIAVKGMLYGTTGNGGTNCPSNNNPSGCGTAFAIDMKTGAETVLYSFCNQSNCTDGAYPEAGLIDVNGTLYGTTSFGGVYACQNMPPGCGTLFSLDPDTGTETVLHSFGNGEDGFHPYTGLISGKGTLYGTTILGGSQHAGTAFALDMSTGTETVIWSFCGTNCFFPSSLIDVGGKLYGTLTDGGTSTRCGTGGCGAVFVLKKRR